MATREEEEKKKEKLPRPLDNGQHTTAASAGESAGNAATSAGAAVGDTLRKLGSRISEIPGLATEGVQKSADLLMNETPLKVVNPYKVSRPILDFGKGFQQGIGQSPDRPPNPALSGSLRGNIRANAPSLAGAPAPRLQAAEQPLPATKPAPAPTSPTGPARASEATGKATNTGALPEPPVATQRRTKVTGAEVQTSAPPGQQSVQPGGFDIRKYLGEDSVEVIRGTTRYLAAPDGSEIRADLLDMPQVARLVTEMDKAVSDARTPGERNNIRSNYMNLVNRMLTDQSMLERQKVASAGAARTAAINSGANKPYTTTKVKVSDGLGGESERVLRMNTVSGDTEWVPDAEPQTFGSYNEWVNWYVSQYGRLPDSASDENQRMLKAFGYGG